MSVLPVTHIGTCDPSGATAFGPDKFLVANDEDNYLRLYDATSGGKPIGARIGLYKHLGIHPQDDNPEADLEAAAVLDGNVYWIGSHGRNKKGKLRPHRYRFMGCTLMPGESGVEVKPFGTASRTLVEDLLSSGNPKIDALGLKEATRLEQTRVPDLAPKKNGLNIEALSSRSPADGGGLLIGLRNPRPDRRAVLIPFLNPYDVVTNGVKASFGDPILLDLQNLGFRSIDHSPSHGGYLILAGSHTTEPGFNLYRWSGDSHSVPELLPETAMLNSIEGFNPEALVLYPGSTQVQVLSDEGGRELNVPESECKEGEHKNGVCKCKHLIDCNDRTFRSIRIEIA